VNTNIANRCLVNPKRFITAVDKAVNTQIREMILPVFSNQSFRPNQHRGIITPVTLLLKKANNNMDAKLFAAGGQPVGAGTGNAFHKRYRFFPTGKHVTGKGTFREYHQVSAIPGSGPSFVQYLLKVIPVFHYLGIHLDAGDLHFITHIRILHQK
jgi:hypothetical protein